MIRINGAEVLEPFTIGNDAIVDPKKNTITWRSKPGTIHRLDSHVWNQSPGFDEIGNYCHNPHPPYRVEYTP